MPPGIKKLIWPYLATSLSRRWGTHSASLNNEFEQAGADSKTRYPILVSCKSVKFFNKVYTRQLNSTTDAFTVGQTTPFGLPASHVCAAEDPSSHQILNRSFSFEKAVFTQTEITQESHFISIKFWSRVYHRVITPEKFSTSSYKQYFLFAVSCNLSRPSRKNITASKRVTRKRLYEVVPWFVFVLFSCIMAYQLLKPQ